MSPKKVFPNARKLGIEIHKFGGASLADAAAFRRVVEIVKTRTAPRIVVVSAKSSNRDIVRALSMGACDYVVKPFDPDELVRTVARVLTSSRTEIDARRKQLMGDAGGVPS